METIESGMVVPAEETPTHSIWLSNLDLLVARSHTPTVYFYPPSAARPIGGFSFAVEALKAALAKVLVPFYPLAGRIGLDPAGRVEIQCTGEGALFMVARSASAMDDVLDDFAPSDTIRQMLVPSVESGNAPCPLVMVQVIFPPLIFCHFSCRLFAMSTGSAKTSSKSTAGDPLQVRWRVLGRSSASHCRRRARRASLRQFMVRHRPRHQRLCPSLPRPNPPPCPVTADRPLRLRRVHSKASSQAVHRQGPFRYRHS